MIKCKEDLFETIFNVSDKDGNPKAELAGAFYDLCQKFDIKVMGGSGRDYFMLAVGGGLTKLCVSPDEQAFGRKTVDKDSTYGSRSKSMANFKEFDASLLIDSLTAESPWGAQTKPTRTEYEKVDSLPTSEVWKAFKEHQEVGHLFVVSKDGYECLGDGIFSLAMAISQGDQLYRKVEKEIDWRDDIESYFESSSKEAGDFEGMEVTNTSWRFRYNPSDEEFLEMCRIALRATGELK